MQDLGEGAISTAPSQNKWLERPFTLFSEKRGNSVIAMLPIETRSEANGGPKKAVKVKGRTVFKAEHWSEKAHRHKRQKGFVSMMLNKFRKDIKLPCIITLTRYAPGKLDKFDNLPMSFKWILDAICEIITGDYRPGHADNAIEDEIDVIYKQVISKEYGVAIQIQSKDV
jgi:hypothetical protein